MRSIHILPVVVVVLMAHLRESHAALFISTAKVNWHAANIACRANGLRLAVIDTPRKKAQAELLIRQHNSPKTYSFWISGTNLHTFGAYAWMSNGRPFEFTDWDVGQPDNYQGAENCVQIWNEARGLKWNDINCQNLYYYLCEDTCCGC